MKRETVGGSGIVEEPRRSKRLHGKTAHQLLAIELAPTGQGWMQRRGYFDRIPRNNLSEEDTKMYLVKWESACDENDKYWWVEKKSIRTVDAVSIPLRNYLKRAEETKKAKQIAKFKKEAEKLDTAW